MGASVGRMPKRSGHAESGGQDARRERPAMGTGSPEPSANLQDAQVENLRYELKTYATRGVSG